MNMACGSSGGYEYDFAEDVDQDFVCPICLLVLREPHQTKCCGHHLCESCTGKLQAPTTSRCPLCQKEGFHTDIDLYFGRKVNELRIRCTRRSNGCQWIGELRGLDDHLAQCRYRDTGPASSRCESRLSTSDSPNEQLQDFSKYYDDDVCCNDPQGKPSPVESAVSFPDLQRSRNGTIETEPQLSLFQDSDFDPYEFPARRRRYPTSSEEPQSPWPHPVAGPFYREAKVMDRRTATLIQPYPRQEVDRPLSRLSDNGILRPPLASTTLPVSRQRQPSQVIPAVHCHEVTPPNLDQICLSKPCPPQRMSSFPDHQGTTQHHGTPPAVNHHPFKAPHTVIQRLPQHRQDVRFSHIIVQDCLQHTHPSGVHHAALQGPTYTQPSGVHHAALQGPTQHTGVHHVGFPGPVQHTGVHHVGFLGPTQHTGVHHVGFPGPVQHTGVHHVPLQGPTQHTGVHHAALQGPTQHTGVHHVGFPGPVQHTGVHHVPLQGPTQHTGVHHAALQGPTQHTGVHHAALQGPTQHTGVHHVAIQAPVLIAGAPHVNFQPPTHHGIPASAVYLPIAPSLPVLQPRPPFLVPSNPPPEYVLDNEPPVQHISPPCFPVQEVIHLNPQQFPSIHIATSNRNPIQIITTQGSNLPKSASGNSLLPRRPRGPLLPTPPGPPMFPHNPFLHGTHPDPPNPTFVPPGAEQPFVLPGPPNFSSRPPNFSFTGPIPPSGPFGPPRGPMFH